MENKLPKFLLKGLKVNCFQGNNDALPGDDEYPYVYHLILDRFNEVTNELKVTYNTLDRNDLNYLKSHLSDLFKQAKELENPIKSNLEKICVETLIELFEIPNDTVTLNCNIVDKVTPNHAINLKPQSNSLIKYEYEDTDDMDNLQKEVLKRRFIDAIIQGGSYLLSKCYHLFLSKIYDLDKRLPNIYDEIIAINDYLLFTENNKITDDNTFQASYVEVIIRDKNQSVVIDSQGLIFPFLLNESIRGLMELFASHGLPLDRKKANYVLKQADFLIAEPWDLRIGVNLYKELINQDEVKANLTPYFIKNLCELTVNDFNYSVKNILAKTKTGKAIFNEILDKSRNDKKNDDFQIKIYDKHSNDAVITDGYYANNDLDELLLDDEI